MIIGKSYGDHLEFMQIRPLLKEGFCPPPPNKKYHKAYYNESLCKISCVYTKIHILLKESNCTRSDDFLQFWVDVFLARFSLFGTTLKEEPLSRYNLEKIIFKMVPRNLIPLKVTRNLFF